MSAPFVIEAHGTPAHAGIAGPRSGASGMVRPAAGKGPRRVPGLPAAAVAAPRPRAPLPVPSPFARVRPANAAPVRGRRAFVLYWMTAARRARANFALQHAVACARELGRPLVVLEGLRCGYRWASDRLHRFVLEGMRANERAFAGLPVLYRAYVEREPGEGRGLVEALAAKACVVVGDDWPCLFLPRLQAAVAARLDVAFELVDGNGLVPLRAATREHLRASGFRRFLQQVLPPHLQELPHAEPLRGVELPRLAALPAAIERRWRFGHDVDEAALPIDHAVAPVAGATGGSTAAAQALAGFLEHRLDRYLQRNQPAAQAQSELSAYLHFGHLGVHEVFAAVAAREDWQPARLAAKPNGKNAGWWGMSPPAEAFLDQLVTWRELAFHTCAFRADYASFASLPQWARTTLDEHRRDRREWLYSHDEFERAATHDPIWNAAQTQLLRTGRIHNYLRMLWGKKVIEWSRTPAAALATLIELNNRWALDGRDPNSYAGILWCFGRYDRPWGPERPVLGTVRYMSSANTERKLDLDRYLVEHQAGD